MRVIRRLSSTNCEMVLCGYTDTQNAGMYVYEELNAITENARRESHMPSSNAYRAVIPTHFMLV